jgi:hypothetical protein
MHPPCLNHFNYTWRSISVMKLLAMQPSPTSCHFMPRGSKYSELAHLILHNVPYYLGATVCNSRIILQLRFLLQ